MSLLDEVVERAQLGVETAAPRRSFTAARDRGVLTLRRASLPWRFAEWLIRAGVVLADTVVARVRVERRDDLRCMEVDVSLDETPWPSIELSGLLEASLSESRGDSLARWRHRVGTAVNGALADGPRWVELHTPIEARRWERGPEGPAHVDPYRARRVASASTGSRFILRVAREEGSLTSKWRRLMGGDDPIEHVCRIWTKSLSREVTSEDASEGVVVARASFEGSILLGGLARWWPRDTASTLMLRREAVLVADLTASIDALISTQVRGTLECDALTLDADGQRVVQNENLHELAAWLEAASQQTSTVTALDAVSWDPPTEVVTGAGETLATDALRASDEIVYAWPHRVFALRRAGVPAVALAPHAVAWLEQNTPASMVPATAFSVGRGLERVDLESLRAGTFDPLVLAHEPTTRAFVHRHAAAVAGVVELHAWGRRLERVSRAELHGVTVVVDLDPTTARDRDAWPEAVDEAVGRVREHASGLTSAVLEGLATEREQLRVPWIGHRVAQLTHGLALRYEPHGEGVRLSWRDDPLLALVVAHERDGTARTLRDALVRYRDVGGIVVGEVESRWRTLESEVAAWSTWILTERGRALLESTVGGEALWWMPMVPEAQLRPAPLAGQSHVRRSERDVVQLRETCESPRVRPLDRAALLAHTLHARHGEQDDHGAARVAMLVVYDPRALHPRTWRTLDALVDLESVGVVPPGAAHRHLEGIVVEAPPGQAYALAELKLVGTVQTTPRPTSRSSKTPSARANTRTWLRHPIAHRLGAGAVALSEGGAGVELWADGLRSETLRLPHPWQDVAGRVWMSSEGRAADRSALRRVLLDAAFQLRTAAQHAASLCVPGSAREDALRAFVAQTTSAQTPAPSKPARVAPSLGSDHLAAALRFALGRALSVDNAMLSWTLVRADDLQTLRVGARHPLIRAARAQEAATADIVAAALAIIYDLAEAGLDATERDTAMARILAALG